MLDENPEEILSLELGNKLYEMSNHLGNLNDTWLSSKESLSGINPDWSLSGTSGVLTVINDIKIPQSSNSVDVDGYLATVVSTADYSPFGAQLDGRTVSAESYRYGFQGQEKDDEIKGAGNSVNYTYRIHDPRLGRFFAVDPLSPSYPWYSPYQFAGNKVISYTELEGLEEMVAYVVQSKESSMITNTSVYKRKADGDISVTYVYLNSDGKETGRETLSNFKKGSAEEYKMNQEYASTGKTCLNAMIVSKIRKNPDGTETLMAENTIMAEKQLVGVTVCQMDLRILFRPNKANITPEELAPGTYDQAMEDIAVFENLMSKSVSFPSIFTNTRGNVLDLSKWTMTVNGETDSQPSSPPFPSINDPDGNPLPEGNKSLGQQRANNLLEVLQKHHPSNNETNVINHSGKVKSGDRNASIFFTPTKPAP